MKIRDMFAYKLLVSPIGVLFITFVLVLVLFHDCERKDKPVQMEEGVIYILPEKQ